MEFSYNKPKPKERDEKDKIPSYRVPPRPKLEQSAQVTTRRPFIVPKIRSDPSKSPKKAKELQQGDVLSKSRAGDESAQGEDLQGDEFFSEDELAEQRRRFTTGEEPPEDDTLRRLDLRPGDTLRGESIWPGDESQERRSLRPGDTRKGAAPSSGYLPPEDETQVPGDERAMASALKRRGVKLSEEQKGGATVSDREPSQDDVQRKRRPGDEGTQADSRKILGIRTGDKVAEPDDETAKGDVSKGAADEPLKPRDASLRPGDALGTDDAKKKEATGAGQKQDDVIRSGLKRGETPRGVVPKPGDAPGGTQRGATQRTGDGSPKDDATRGSGFRPGDKPHGVTSPRSDEAHPDAQSKKDTKIDDTRKGAGVKPGAVVSSDDAQRKRSLKPGQTVKGTSLRPGKEQVPSDSELRQGTKPDTTLKAADVRKSGDSPREVALEKRAAKPGDATKGAVLKPGDEIQLDDDQKKHGTKPSDTQKGAGAKPVDEAIPGASQDKRGPKDGVKADMLKPGEEVLPDAIQGKRGAGESPTGAVAKPGEEAQPDDAQGRRLAKPADTTKGAGIKPGNEALPEVTQKGAALKPGDETQLDDDRKRRGVRPSDSPTGAVLKPGDKALPEDTQRKRIMKPGDYLRETGIRPSDGPSEDADQKRRGGTKPGDKVPPDAQKKRGLRPKDEQSEDALRRAGLDPRDIRRGGEIRPGDEPAPKDAVRKGGVAPGDIQGSARKPSTELPGGNRLDRKPAGEQALAQSYELSPTAVAPKIAPTSLSPAALQLPTSRTQSLSESDARRRSVGVVSPTSSGGGSSFDTSDHRQSVSTFDYQQLPTDPNVQTVYVPPAAAALLAKFKPYDELADKRLKARIAARTRHDKEKAERQALDEAKLVDGNLVSFDNDDEDKFENDPKLAEGKNLPKSVANYFPHHLIGLPIEDVDHRNREYEETFMVIGRRFDKFGVIYRFSATPSWWLFRPWNPVRKACIYAYTHPLFDIIVIFTILANSLYMAMNVDERVPEYTFLAVYTLESMIKSTARGLILSDHTYLRDAWNWLDLVVLISAYATIIAEFASSGDDSIGSSLKGLKALRVFRVLKTVALIPGLKTIIEALIRALKMLGDVLIMTLLFFTIFALFGTQIYQGTLQTKCVRDADLDGYELINETQNATNHMQFTWRQWVYNMTNWEMQDDEWQLMVCGNVSMSQICPKNYTCLSLDDSPNPNNDFTKFDNFFTSFMVAVQLFNTDYWDYLYHAVLAANGPTAFLFFVAGILFLNFYLANLVQAVVALSYQVEEEDEEDEDDAYIQSKKASSKRRFVFDPNKLRVVMLGPSPRARSLMSVKNVTMKRLSAVAPSLKIHPADEDVIPDNSNGRPIAVVKPQISSRQSNRPSTSDQNTNTKWPGNNNYLRYRVASRPPSAVGQDDVSKIGFWDRNPMCCFKCCVCFFPWLKVQSYLYLLVTDPFFELFITVAIAVNTVSMAAYYHMIPEEINNVLNTINEVCTYIFIAEAILKLMALCGEYFDNKWNWLDLFVVITSIVDIATSQVANIGFNTSIIRLLRLLRILKLAQSWKTMRQLLEIIFGTFRDILNLLVVLVIVMFVFAVIGMQLFGGTYTLQKFPGHPGARTFTPFPGFHGVPEWHFDDFFHSFMLVFRVLCRETWQPMLDCITANNAAICIPYFLATLLVGSYVVLNLFLAVLLNAFNADDIKKTDEEESKLTKRIRNITRAFKRFFKGKFSFRKKKVAAGHAEERIKNTSTTGADSNEAVRDEDEDDQDDEQDDTETKDETETKGDKSGKLDNQEDTESTTGAGGQGTQSTVHSTASGDLENARVRDACWPICEKSCSFFFNIFARETPTGRRLYKARKFANDICNHKVFEYTILAFIFSSSITLCLQDATLKDDSDLGIALRYLDYVYLAIFAIEMIIKLFAQGFRVYFTSFWTILDFLIVVTGFIDVIISEIGSAVDLSALRALRTLRALRPLRAISRWQGMKIVVNALFYAIPGIVNVLLVVLIIWLIFAIMGVQFFSGKFWMCVDVDSGNRTAIQLVPNREVCDTLPGKWKWAYFYINFDNVLNALFALFQMASFEGWTTIFQFSVDAPEKIDDQPAPELNIYYYVYYVVFIILCSFFLLNLFVGVIIEDFNALKKKYEGGSALTLFMTDSQKNYYTTISKLGSKKPRKTIVKPKNVFGLFCFDIGISQKFEFGIAIVIFANVIVMATEHFRQPINYTVIQDVMNLVFTVIFTLEAALKLIGLRGHYFRSAWNIFDFIIVILSLGTIILQETLTSLAFSPSVLRVFRVLRVGRILRLIRASKGVRKLMLSLMMSLPALLNIGSLLFLIIFIYAIIGMNLFGHLGHREGNLDDVVNFHTFPGAMMTLFRLTTVSGWDNVHQGLSFTDDLGTGCNPDVDVLDKDYPKNNPCCNRTAWVRPNGELVVEQGGSGNCGNYSLGSIYIVTYLLFTYFIVVNMFAAVILDNYQQASQQEDIGVTDDDIDRFYAIWEQYDPLATQFIKYQDLSNFTAALDGSLSCPKPNEHVLTLLDIPIMKDGKTGEEIIHCLDVLMALVRKALGSVDETDDFSQVRINLESMFKTTFPNRVQVEKVCTTKIRKKEDVAAKTLQRAYRNWKAGRNLRRAARARGMSIAVPSGQASLFGMGTTAAVRKNPPNRK